MKTTKTLALFALPAILAACSHTQPAVEIREVLVPTPVPCVDQATGEAAVAGKPADLAPLTGDANRDLPVVYAKALDWKAYALDMLAIVKGCGG